MFFFVYSFWTVIAGIVLLFLLLVAPVAWALWRMAKAVQWHRFNAEAPGAAEQTGSRRLLTQLDWSAGNLLAFTIVALIVCTIAFGLFRATFGWPDNTCDFSDPDTRSTCTSWEGDGWLFERDD